MNIAINNVDMVDNVDVVDNVEAIRIPRQIYVRFDTFNYYSDEEFFKRFRLTKPTILYLLEQVEVNLEYIAEKNNSISPMDQFLITLRIYATGGHLITIGEYIHCDKSSVSRIVAKVSRVIAGLSRQYIHMPRNPAEIAKRQNDFYEVAGFPKVIGAIDGSHIKINSQGGLDAEIFRNRKGYFSINIQAVASADLLFQDIVARWPGSAHDSTIFNSGRLKYQFENDDFGDSFLLGDSGYMNRSYLLTPFLRPQHNAEIEYNRCHILSRVKVEHLFGVWKRRFPIMAYGCRLKLATTLHAIVATAVLHNIARLRGEPEPMIEDDIMQHELQQLIVNGNTPEIPNGIEHRDAFDSRRQLVQRYFNRM